MLSRFARRPQLTFRPRPQFHRRDYAMPSSRLRRRVRRYSCRGHERIDDPRVQRSGLREDARETSQLFATPSGSRWSRRLPGGGRRAYRSHAPGGHLARPFIGHVVAERPGVADFRKEHFRRMRRRDLRADCYLGGGHSSVLTAKPRVAPIARYAPYDDYRTPRPLPLYIEP